MDGRVAVPRNGMPVLVDDDRIVEADHVGRVPHLFAQQVPADPFRLDRPPQLPALTACGLTAGEERAVAVACPERLVPAARPGRGPDPYAAADDGCAFDRGRRHRPQLPGP